MGTTSEHTAAPFRTEATFTDREAHLLVSSSKTGVPPKGHGAPLTFRPCSLSVPLSLSDLLFSAVLLSSACKSTDTAIIPRTPDPVLTTTCKNCPERVRKEGRLVSGALNQTDVEKKKSDSKGCMRKA